MPTGSFKVKGLSAAVAPNESYSHDFRLFELNGVLKRASLTFRFPPCVWKAENFMCKPVLFGVFIPRPQKSMLKTNKLVKQSLLEIDRHSQKVNCNNLYLNKKSKYVGFIKFIVPAFIFLRQMQIEMLNFHISIFHISNLCMADYKNFPSCLQFVGTRN